MSHANVELFRGARRVEIHGNAGIHIQNHSLHQSAPPNPVGPGALEKLFSYSASGCLYNAADRFNPPKCAPETRENILRIIEKWILEDKHGKAALMWLFGAAGAGKSAIAQTTVENCIPKGLHAASFFFSRIGATERSDARRLLPTITYQVMTLFESARPRIEKVIRDNPHLFETQMRDQMDLLLIRPLKTKWYRRLFQILRPPKARLVVIDGLDECSSVEQQKEILGMLAEALPLLPYPFRFLIVSRPEAHIFDMFRHHPVFKNIDFAELDLGTDVDADKSIETFLRQSFEYIRSSHRLAKDLGPEWPSQDAIDNIVAKASGNFIYAATVIKYVEHVKFRPDKRLAVILGLAIKPVKDDPFAQLNALYMLIYETASNEQWDILECVFGILYLSTLQQHKYLVVTPAKLEHYLGLEEKVLLPMLDDFLSLLQVFDEHPIKIYHASLFDFLLDPERSQQYCLDVGKTHQRLAEHFMPQEITRSDEVLWLTFLHHCQQATLSSKLKKYLQELPLLYHPEFSPYWGYLPFLYYMAISVLARPEFDESRHWYSYHLSKLKGGLEEDKQGMLPPVFPASAVDLGDKVSNDTHELFTLVVQSFVSKKIHPAPLNAISELSIGDLKDWDSTTKTLKHVLLASLPVSQPSNVLYKTYSAYAQLLVPNIKDSVIDGAIKVRLETFLELRPPEGTEGSAKACREAWSSVANTLQG